MMEKKEQLILQDKTKELTVEEKAPMVSEDCDGMVEQAIEATDILSEINSPEDLKSLTLVKKQQLAAEIRERILNVVATNGGHLAPNLGVVELTIAIHSIFDLSKDRLVWDVGHQCYAHKILTGRNKNFNTLRQFKGIAGFPKRTESVYDAFNTGHSSTSISAAIGLAKARDLKQEDHHVLAVIGDGALTGGMAFEALNHGGDLHTRAIIILNDNEMSIDSNVGALANYLVKMRSNPRYWHVKQEFSSVLKKIPFVGRSLNYCMEKIKSGLRFLLVEDGMFFEQLGYKYFGPIDGHDIYDLETVLARAKEYEDGPVVIHVKTKKGKGYKFAEDDPDKFHGISPFDLATGQTKGGSHLCPTYTQVFADTLIDLAKDDKNLVAITAAMPSGTGLNLFKQHYPERFFDVGIAEQHALTFAAGLAVGGLHPVVALYSTFLQRGYDQLLHDICAQNLPVIIAIDRAGVVGEDGETHQGIFDISFVRNLPNITLMAPSNENELKQMLYTASQMSTPVAIRYPRGSGIGVELKPYEKIPLGHGVELCYGQHLTIAAIGNMVNKAKEVRKYLAEHLIYATIVDMRFIKPLDTNILKVPKKIVTIEDNILSGGFGSACMEALEGSNKDILRFGYGDDFIPQGKVDILQIQAGLTAKQISDKIINHWFNN